jgi:hypothetical protein
MEIKRHWLGQHWYLPGDAGNEINRVSVANRRATFSSFRCVCFAFFMIADLVHPPIRKFADQRPEQPARV